MDRNHIEKIAKTSDDKVLLAKVRDKILSGAQRNVTANTCFLSLRELELCRYLFGNMDGLVAFGGYETAERKMLVYLPEYLEEADLLDSAAPMVCLRALFAETDALSHRDFLGALMGAGIAREAIGDICVGKDSCDFFVMTEIAPYLLQNLTGAGRTRFHLQQIPLAQAQIPVPEVKQIRDTLASLRLDSVIASGFRIGRSQAAQYIHSGRAAIDGLPCEKPDKPVAEGCKISVRGLGKIQVRFIGGQTKKGRISVTIDRYI